MAKIKPNRIIFKIDAFTPSTLPMETLAEYIKDLATLLGSQDDVHFERVGKGSVSLVQRVDEKSLLAVRQRLAEAKTPTGPPEAVGAYSRINERLAKHKAVGRIRLGSDKVIQFPGRNTQADRTIGPVVQNEYLDGQLVRVGGFDETVPVHLRGDQNYFCTTNVAIAKELGPYLYGPTIRVFGKAYWYRDAKGQWTLDRFTVESFQALSDASLAEAVDHLRAVPHDGWDDATAEKINLRSG
ncbi:MAG: hypothetical protein ACLQOO_05710 [Terriglobia bacterium]